MVRSLLILSAMVLAAEAVRAWWLHPPPGKWEAVPVPVLNQAALESESGFNPLSAAEHLETGPLRFDEAAYLRGQHEGKYPLSVVFFTYRPQNPHLWTDLFTHPPEVCMRTSGCTLERTYPARQVEFEGQSIPVRILKYRDPTLRAPLFIFKAVWLPAQSPIQPGTTAADRRSLWVSMALNRIPHPPGAVLLTGLWGLENEEAAWEVFQQQVARHLTPSQT